MAVNVGTVAACCGLSSGLRSVAWAGGILPQIGAVPSPWSWIAEIVGAGLAMTALVGTCPAYALLGISTCTKRA